MDVYGMLSASGHDMFGVDDFFDFSSGGADRDADVFSLDADVFSASTTTGAHLFHHVSSSSGSASDTQFHYGFNDNTDTSTGCYQSTDFTDHFCIPSDDVAELEWLSNFVDDSASNFPANNIAGTINFRPEKPSFHSRSRTKRTRAPSNNTSWTTPVPKKEVYTSSTSSSSETAPPESHAIRRCTHCASEKTPQWRTGPLGPKTLCNACGVRYKSGRLVPEYRPAASPTFVLTQHSNSHRKVMELRRQKEMMLTQQQVLLSSEHQMYAGRHNHRQQQQQQHGTNYEVC